MRAEVAAAPGEPTRFGLALAVATAMLAVLLGGAAVHLLQGASQAVADSPKVGVAATFVGSTACAACHPVEAALWRGSQHERAMQHASDKTVLGDFDDARFGHFGVTSRFFRQDGRYLVETDGPDGKLATFEVTYTFGVSPLQQYLVAFPDGRLQALSIAWDSRPREQGGQRWFHLYPDEAIRHDDVLHWTKLNQNWNFMCAECHSTGVHKNYDPTRDRFATTWAEISVGCEGCHGQGSGHVAWAHRRQAWWTVEKAEDPDKGLLVRFDERRDRSWPLDPATGNPIHSDTPPALRKEVETCGFCHARRSTLSEDWVPGRWLSDTHQVAPLAGGLYHADGQMLGEVYNYGSFKQSRMFAAGVTCSDCHEPHGASLRLPGDGVCLRCHASTRYAVATHHRHAGVDPPLACAACHMPARTYMVVDRRHDHSLRIPRPDLSVKLGTPNACNDCHVDKPARWAAAAVEGWYGPERKGFQHYAEAFVAGREDRAGAGALLAAIASERATPAFVRGSALSELAEHLSVANIDLARAGLADPDPMVRIGALDMLEGASASRIWPLVAPLLADPSRGVRLRAIMSAGSVPNANPSPDERERFERAEAEFIASQTLNADRPEAHSALGTFQARRGRVAEAEAAFKTALRLSPHYAGAAINLADLYRNLGRDQDGEGVLRQALDASPQEAGLHHALGLTLIRLKRREQALGNLRRAAELAPDQARYAYVYAVGLHSAGQASEALAFLKDSLARHPNDRATLSALVSFNRDAGDFALALAYAQHLARVTPADPRLSALIESLRRAGDRPETR